ncbi:MAG: endopeptidase La [Elusimicrobiales bacterium]
MPQAETKAEQSARQLPSNLSVIAIRDVVMFPGMALPLSVDREKSVRAIDHALKTSKYVLAVSQKNPRHDDPKPENLYAFGVVCEVAQSLKMPDNTVKVFLQGIARARTANLAIDKEEGCWFADVEYAQEETSPEAETLALSRQVMDAFESYAKVSRRIAVEGVSFLRQIENPSKLADTIASNIIIKTQDRQDLLETVNPARRLEKLLKLLTEEIEILSLEEKIHTKVRSQIEKSQKEYYLTEQMKAIQKELHQKDDFHKELDEVRKLLKKNRLSDEARAAAEKELNRLDRMAPSSPEATVSRTYLDWLVNLPWQVSTKDLLDIARARKILDEDHYGLDKPKERVLEFLAVTKLTGALRGPVLCFVGPPGVGKTSLAKSIARAVDRKFVRMSLGGVRDEAEIRGHRRTYVGSLPGRIMQSISKAKSNNPVFLLDEIDKMGMDWRGDPAAALLEVLDPEQNSDFTDHYLDVGFDISKVMFVTTANSLEGIPQTLRDRLEVLEFSGYTHDEKLSIAEGHLIPKQLKLHGLSAETAAIDAQAVTRAEREYTREAGVRNLEREIGSLCRKAAKEYVETGKKVSITGGNIEKYLGIPKFQNVRPEENAVGVSTGLAWTQNGGEVLSIEAVSYPGKGDLVLTGKLGDVMKESASAAFTCVKSLKIKKADFGKSNFHVHVPEGAVPKDGPSAGVAMAVALASLASGRPVRGKLAMTGELTITGRVLPVGGIKEKFMAAFREGMDTIVFPKANAKDVSDVPEKVRGKLKLVPVTELGEALRAAIPSLK